MQVSVRRTRKKAYRGNVLSTIQTPVGDSSTEVLIKERGVKAGREQTYGNSNRIPENPEVKNASWLGTGLALPAKRRARGGSAKPRKMQENRLW